MQKKTLNIFKTILESDCTVSPVEFKRLVRLVVSDLDDESKPDRIVRRREAALLLGRSAKTIDRLVQRGCIGKVTFPGHKRAAGFRFSDIARLIAAGGNGDDGDGDCKALADR